MIPFEALKLPFDNTLIDVTSFFSEYGMAVKNLSRLDEKLKSNDISAVYSLKHLVKTESFYSTKIEGTHTTIDEVYEAETAPPGTKKSDDISEVLRYNQALIEGIEYITKEKLITNKMIMNLHETLLSGDVRKNSNLKAGVFRYQQNKVGDHTPPSATIVPELMGNLERYINDSDFDTLNLPAIIKIAIIHSQFETIHPFPDGNGRVGRVLIPLYLYKEQEIEIPCFFISQELERNTQKYYNYLQGTRNKNADGFTKWIRFFLTSVVKQCERDILFIDQLENLRKQITKQLTNQINSVNIESVVEAIFLDPIFTCKMLSEKTGIKESTIRKYIQKMIDLEIIFSSQQKRNKRYYFTDLLDLIRS